MTRTRVRQLCAAAIVFAALAATPSTAGAHPAECAITGGLAAAPTSEWFAENYGCEANVAVRGADTRARPAKRATMATGNERGRLKEVGHEPLMGRGMNAAIAVHEDYAYIGSRTDGGHQGMPHGGILVVDISDPSEPEVVGGPFDAKPGESSRELRVWQSEEILIVLDTNCGEGDRLHHCTRPSISNIRFYDISGRDAARPRLLHQFDVDTHEFFLWQDPKNPERALIFAGNAGSTCGTRGGAPSCPFSVWDISQVPDGGEPEELYSDVHGYTELPEPAPKPTGGLHSLTVSNDGRKAYFALLTGGFAIVDTSDFAAGAPFPVPRLITANEARPTWAGPGAHSAVKLWGRDWAWVSDEVYGSATGDDHGCPWGWARMVDISDPEAPEVEAEYIVPENDPSTCAAWNPPRTSYSAHNPTLTPHIAFSTWHSGGFQAVNLEKPWRPSRLAQFTPEPLDSVMLEDPRLSSDPDTGRDEKVVMWSYAIVKDGLIYVVDLRNGLYVLEYKGPYSKEVRRVDYLDGNSNQGDALCFEPVGRTPRHCR
jgi:hypothetical protein